MHNPINRTPPRNPSPLNLRGEGLPDYEELIYRLKRIEAKLDLILKQPSVKEFYTVEEFARLIDRTRFTVREYCRLGRINAEKRDCGRGNAQDWKISHAELLRYRNDGLLPLTPRG